MRRLFLTIVCCVSILTSYAQHNLKVATFNIRLQVSSDSGNLWEQRKKPVTNLIQFHDFDIVGIQEAVPAQVADLNAMLQGYSSFGHGRDDGKDKGEHARIYFKKSIFKFIAGGDFWLSPTPDVPSKGWDATCCNRICSWVKLEYKGKPLFVFNVHMDHQGMEARRQGAKLILHRVDSIAGNAPVIFMGDFNGGRDTEWYQTVEKSKRFHDSYHDVLNPYEPNGSFNGFGKTLPNTEVIDHIFLSPEMVATKWAVLTDTYQGKFPSDHFPVMVEIRFRKK